MNSVTITDVRAFVLDQKGSGGDYHDREEGHYLVDTLIATPMSPYPEYKQSRISFGINVMNSIVVEVEASDGTVGISAGQGGAPACYMIEEHFKCFLIGQDPRSLNKIWDQMFRASLFYGRKGIPLWALSAVDLALWDLLGILRQEPIYQMIGGATRDEIELYCTGIRPDVAKEAGFIGGKMPLSHGPVDRREGLKVDFERFRDMRERVGPDFLPMADCWMALDVPYAVEVAYAMRELDLILARGGPAARQLRRAHPQAARPPDALDHRRARVHPLRLPQAHRDPLRRHLATGCDVVRRPHRAATHLRDGRGLRHSRGAPRQRRLQLPLRHQPAPLPLLRIPQHQPRLPDLPARVRRHVP